MFNNYYATKHKCKITRDIVGIQIQLVYHSYLEVQYNDMNKMIMNVANGHCKFVGLKLLEGQTELHT